jgi:hypothetical protein
LHSFSCRFYPNRLTIRYCMKSINTTISIQYLNAWTDILSLSLRDPSTRQSQEPILFTLIIHIIYFLHRKPKTLVVSRTSTVGSWWHG